MSFFVAGAKAIFKAAGSEVQDIAGHWMFNISTAGVGSLACIGNRGNYNSHFTTSNF